MPYSVVSLPFGSGLDSKTDPKMVEAPKPVLLQDCIFTNTKRVLKRNGYNTATKNIVGGGTWSSPTMTKSYNNESLLAALSSVQAGQRLFSYSEDLNAWQDKGQYQSIGVSKQTINALQYSFEAETPSVTDSFGTYNSSCVVIGNIALFVFDGMSVFGYANTTNATYITVVDLETGVHLADTIQITNALGFSKAAVLANNTFAVFYISSTTTNHIYGRVITVTKAGGVVIGSEVNVGNCQTESSISGVQFPYSYDVVTTTSGCILALANLASSSIVKLYSLTVSLTTAASVNVTTSGNITSVSTFLDSSGNVWVYYASGGSALYYFIYSSSLSLVLGVTEINSGLANITQIMAINTSAVTQDVYFSQYVYTTTTASVIIPNISIAGVTNTGTVVLTDTVIQGCDLYGKSFVSGGISYFPVITLSQSNSTGFLINSTEGTAVAKFLQTSAEGIYQAGYGITGSTIVAASLVGGEIPWIY